MNSEYPFTNKLLLNAIAKHCNGTTLINFSNKINHFLNELYLYIFNQKKFNIKDTRMFIFQEKNVVYLELIMENLKFNENQIVTIINDFLNSVENNFFECKKEYDIKRKQENINNF